MIDYANALNDLASPPGNRLEALRGDPKGFHGVRVNDRDRRRSPAQQLWLP